jgi:hypothetical protein
MPEPIHYFIVALILGFGAYVGAVFLLTTVLPLFMVFTREFKPQPLTSQVRPKHYDYDEDY